MAKQRTSARTVFADHMRAHRQNKKLSQEALAELCHLHRTYIGSVERAERNISIDNMERLADSLEVPLEKLIREGKS